MNPSTYATAALLAVGLTLPAAAQYPTRYAVPAGGDDYAPAPVVIQPTPAQAAYQATYGFTHPDVKAAQAEADRAVYGYPTYSYPTYSYPGYPAQPYYGLYTTSGRSWARARR